MPRYASKNPNLIHLGLSRDQRTNVWHVVCPHCNYTNKPQTTMRSSQVFDCDKCLTTIYVNYNDEIVRTDK
jgi:transposase-like protein